MRGMGLLRLATGSFCIPPLPKVHAWIPFSLHMLKQKIKAKHMEKEKRRILLGIFDLLTERGLLTKEENRKMRVLLSTESKSL